MEHVDDEEMFAQLHDGLPKWTAVAVWMDSQAASYATFGAAWHIEPRVGDLMEVLRMHIERRDEATARNTMVDLIHYPSGAPVALSPQAVVSIMVSLHDPDNKPILKVAPGYVDREGPVERDADGVLLPGQPLGGPQG